MANNIVPLLQTPLYSESQASVGTITTQNMNLSQWDATPKVQNIVDNMTELPIFSVN